MDGGLDAGETGESAVSRNETLGNATSMEGLSHQFIYSVYAQAVSGVFVWIALILTCVQVYTTAISLSSLVSSLVSSHTRTHARTHVHTHTHTHTYTHTLKV